MLQSGGIIVTSFKNYYLSVVIIFILNVTVKAQINLSFGSNYKYLKGTATIGLSPDWINPDFNDYGWFSGDAPFRYGDGTGGTVLSDMHSNYTTVFLRSTFNASGTDELTNIFFSIDYDDGFVVWVNGEIAISQFAPDNIIHSSTATELHESGTPEIFTVSAQDLPLIEGSNTVAIVLLNENVESSDIYFDMSISATPTFQGEENISFSHASGFYSSPFNTTISSADPTVTLYYTLDGSNPQNSPTRITGGSTVVVNINPASTTNRPKTPAVIMRVSATKAGYSPSFPIACTFIFIDNVKTQGYPGGDWPNWNVNGQYIDYNMDPDVVNDSRYSNLIDDALLDIPSISVITSNKYLFDTDSGIYVNAWGHGREWERECSVELIYPDATEGFNVNGGLRIRGGWSRHNNFPKHAFRLFFRSIYGNAKLEYPLFEDEGVSEYDKIDLRCSQNYAWANGDGRNTYVREVFSRDTQRDMNQPYTRSRYYHLYLNGMYWGVFQTQERSEARFASDYFGDSKEDYDVVKVSTENWDYRIEATDGSTDAWLEIYNLLNRDISQNQNYYIFEGKNAYGKPIPGGKKLIDIDNLIDYMLTIFYTGNFDAPTSSFMGNNGPNNFYAIYNRKDESKGFIFFNHDAEHALMIDETWPGIGITENRVDLGSRSDETRMTVNSFSVFHPQWLHYKLSANEEYRMRFADRASMHMIDEGALDPDICLDRFNERVSEIELAIIAESARWGDSQSGSAYTKHDNWLPTINQVRDEFFPFRTDIVINQLKQEDLLPDILSPLISSGGLSYLNGSYDISSSLQLTIENINSGGNIYYTINGKDPRAIGGNIASYAIAGGNSVIMNLNSSAIIKARILRNGEWSPLRDVTFISENDDYSKLKVTEIHYHPQDLIVGTDTTSGKSFEFIEFRNTGETALNISGFVIDSAVHCEFPPNSILAPQDYFVAAAKPEKFYQMYGYVASANFSGNLSNSGEEILLIDSEGNEIMRFTYDDHNPWPEEPDGSGPSMVSVDANPVGNPGDPYYWRTSIRIGGSPFETDTPLSVEDETIVENSSNQRFLVYPNPTSGQVMIQMIETQKGENVNVKLYNLGGTLLYSDQLFNDFDINLSNLDIDPGLYILRIESLNGVETYKLVYNR